MTIRNDLIAAGSAADAAVPDPAEGFDELLAASSLGAPHVQAFMEPLPAAVAQRISEHLGHGAAGDDTDVETVQPHAAPPAEHSGDERQTLPEEAGPAQDPGPVLWTQRATPAPRPGTLVLSASNGVGKTLTALMLIKEMLHSRELRSVSHSEYRESAPAPLMLLTGDAGTGKSRLLAASVLRQAAGLAHGHAPALAPDTGPEPIRMVFTGQACSGKTIFLQTLFATARPADPDTLFGEVLRALVMQDAAAITSCAVTRRLPERPRREAHSSPTSWHDGVSSWLGDAYRTGFRHREETDEQTSPSWWHKDLFFAPPPICFADGANPDHDELHRCLQALRCATGRHQPRPAIEDLQDRVRTVDIPVLHFAGHGDWHGITLTDIPGLGQEAGTAGPGADALLLVTDGILQPRDLSLGQNLTFLVADACSTPAPAPSPTDPSAAAADLPQGVEHLTQANTILYLADNRVSAAKPAPTTRTRFRPRLKTARLHLDTETTDGRTTLRAQVRMHLLAPGKQDIDVPTELVYRSHDPYAVEMVFNPAGKPPAAWTFSRDLVTEGLIRPAGTGDVRIWSDPPELLTPDSNRCVHISLEAPDGHAHLAAQREDIEEFITATRKIVPPGREHTRLASAFDELATAIQPSTSGA
jgi:hypothetical protein